MKRKRMAVLILNYNGKRYLADCYRSLAKQTSREADLYLVDNNSTDGSSQYTRKFFPDVRIINTGGNLGFTGAYNKAADILRNKSHRYDFFFFLNNDTICDTRLVFSMIRIFDHDESVGIVTPTIRDSDRRIAMSAGRFLPLTGTTTGLDYGKPYKRSSQKYECFWASGCALAIRAPLFYRCGMFSNYFIYYEDVDISWQVRNRGYKVVATNETYVIHFQGKANTPSNTQLYLCERNRLLTYWQNLSSVMFFSILPIFLVLRIVLLFYLSKNVAHVGSKLRGLIDAFRLLHRYQKRTVSLLTHLQVVLSMPTIRPYRH